MEEMWFDPQYPPGPIRAQNGSASAPSFSFEGDVNTGLYRSATADVLRVAAGGSQVANFGTAGFSVVSGVLKVPDGDASNPTYSFSSDDDTGFYYGGTNTIYVSNGGTLAAVFDPGYFQHTGRFFGGNGSAAAPTYGFGTDQDIGIYRSGTDGVGIASNGTAVSVFDSPNGGLFMQGSSKIYNTAGSAGTPSYSFNGDSDTGVYRVSPNTVGIAGGGVSIAEFTGASSTFKSGGSTRLIVDSNGLTLNGASKILASSGNDIWLDASAGDDVLITAGDDIIFFYTPGGVPTEVMRIDEGNTRIQFSIITNFNATMGNSTKDPTTDAPVDWVEVQIAGVTHYLPAYAA